MLLPEDPPWWELFNATKEEITIVSKTILTLYACVTRRRLTAAELCGRRCPPLPIRAEYCGVLRSGVLRFAAGGPDGAACSALHCAASWYLIGAIAAAGHARRTLTCSRRGRSP
jgi:hypothetical protein